VREKAGRLPKIDPNFNVSFPTTPCSPTLNKTNVVHNDLKKDAINEFGLTYWTSIPVWVNFQEHVSSFYVNIEEKVWLLVKKYGLEKTDRANKTSLFDRKWVTSLKPRRRSCPLRQVWWALELWLINAIFNLFFSYIMVVSLFDRGTPVTQGIPHHRLFTNHCHWWTLLYEVDNDFCDKYNIATELLMYSCRWWHI
jgi:hypothetical protein